MLVTGSPTGIGAAVARGFGAEGMRVAVHGNSNMEQAEQVAADIRAAGGSAVVLRADVRGWEACARLVGEAHAALGGLDVLVNNAGGVVDRSPIRDATDLLFDQVMALNANSVFACSRAALPIMEAAGGGAYLYLASGELSSFVTGQVIEVNGGLYMP